MAGGGAFRFPVYQIDFSAVAAGKRVAATKRRIRWYVGLFGVRSNLDAASVTADAAERGIG